MPQTRPRSSRCPARQRGWPLPLLVSLALSLGWVTGVHATTTWTVCTSGCDYTSIQAAIAASTTLNGDTLAIASGTYTEAGILVNKSLTLQGANASSTIVQAAATPGTASTCVFNIDYGVTVTIRNLTIRYGSGSGLSNGGTLTLSNSTISGNTAPNGGGIFNAQHAPLTLTNSTVSGNAATYGGGLYNQGLLTLTNSIVAKNPSGGDCLAATISSITSDGYNLDSDRSCHLTAPTDRPGVDPLLGPLQDNGGPTFTQALSPGSPAMDAIPLSTNGCGTTLISDQRWRARPQPAGGSCDIGAYEVEVAGQTLDGWVTGLTLQTVRCTNVATRQRVTISPRLPRGTARRRA